MSATNLTLDTPAPTTPGAPITLTGTYQGTPDALQYSFGSGWITAPQPSFDQGTFSFTLPAGLPAGTYTPLIRDPSAQAVTDVAGLFVVSPWTPLTLSSSPGAAAVFEFNANNPACVAGAPGAAVLQVLNALDRTESLTAVSASNGNPVVVVDDSGADGKRRVLQFNPTNSSPNLYDPNTNWLDAGGVNGSAGSGLVDLANSSDLSTSGSFTTIIALKIDTAYSYAAGPIWGALASPGPLQYAQLRVNMGSGVEGADLTSSSEVATNAQGPVTPGWHVLTMIKDGDQLTYRVDGKVVQTSTITSTNPFTATDFMIGGGFPQGPTANLAQENGVPPSDVGEFQAYTGVLAGTDLANAEALAANAIGISLTPAPSAPGPTVITLGSTPTVLAASGGDTVYGGTGAATVTALSGPVLMIAGAGPLTFVGGDAPSTVLSGSGSTTLFGGAGGAALMAGSGGNSVLVAGGGNSTLTGGADGDRLFGSATGQDVLAATHGRETLVGGSGSSTLTGGGDTGAVIFTSGNSTVTGGAAGADTVVGGAGTLQMTMHDDALFAGSGAASVDGASSGSDSIVGGSGAMSVTGHGSNMLVVAGSASSNIATGDGASLIFAGTGMATIQEGTGAATIVVGSGSARIGEGTGALTVDVIKGSAGGAETISGFRPSVDRIDLFGYGTESPGVELIGGNSVVSLSDGTRITLLGVDDPGASVV